MTNKEARRESFVVRIWWEKGQPEWKVWVRHVCSGDSALFQDLHDLISYLERWTAKQIREDRRGLR